MTWHFRLPADSAAHQRHVQARGTSIVLGNDEHGMIRKRGNVEKGLPDPARTAAATTTETRTIQEQQLQQQHQQQHKEEEQEERVQEQQQHRQRP